jgi:hypothetical protein
MLVQVLRRASGTDYRMTEELMGSRTIIVTVVTEGATKR